ncbi:hypothetical protein [Bradymonas sediminis]|uniref:Uncharacterized protein n=1 Tax=Bradymonas sediminis TaxID=1548548 RepID=A0A2Z4FPT5_9DELT|nr:hypothetical protein [Bradymonas sediminis]AWV91037.1 hypothetical protein DN745_17555 [Bradymonas sediminis]
MEILEAPEEAWAEEYEWSEGERFELKVPQDRSARVMLLPLWGWVRVVYRYRFTWHVADADTIDRIDADVFEGPGGRVLVVAQYDGVEEELPFGEDDYTHNSGANVWEAPARVAEVPLELVDVGGRREFQNWLLDGVAPVASHWHRSRDIGIDARFEKVSVVDPAELADWLVEAATELKEELGLGWRTRDISVADAPRMVVHYPDGRFQIGAVAAWALGYEGRVGGVDFMMVLVFERWRSGKLRQHGQMVWGDAIEAVVDAYGEEGLARLLTGVLFERNAWKLQGMMYPSE